MSQSISPSTNKRYGLARVCRIWGLSRATVYRRRGHERTAAVPGKRGPKMPWTDAELLEVIREDLRTTEWVGEGYRKVWARLRTLKNVRTSVRRVLRLMRKNGLLAPHRERRTLGPRVHDGTIIPERPNAMWGTDATATLTAEDGQVTVFIAVDHFTGVRGYSWSEAGHALRGPGAHQAGRPPAVWGRGVATGLSVRHDHGSQYVSDAFQDELEFLGITSSPSFVRSPEGNGCAERIIRTLKEQLHWLQPFKNVEELRLALHDWMHRYNRSWLIERHGFLTPEQDRRRHEEQLLAA